MKKKLIIILIGLFILIGGYLMIGEYKKMQLVKEAQKKAEIFIHRNYEGVNEVFIDKEYYEITPMGALMVGGHVNGNDKLFFNINFNISKNQVGKVTSIVVNPKEFPPEKEECKDNFCQ